MAAMRQTEGTPVPEAQIQEKEVFGLVLGKVITQLREQRGLKQAQLAAQLGISQPVMSRIESGKVQPGIFLLRQIAEALSTDVPTLTALVQEALTRTTSGVEATTQKKAATPVQAWNHAIAVAGVSTLLGLIAFAVAAALNSASEEAKATESSDQGSAQD